MSVPLIPLLVMAVLVLAMGLIFIRLIWGPSISDRVVALDVLSAVAIGLIATYTVAAGTTALLDAALVIALVSFVGTVAFGHFVERRAVP
jgi:multicomponent Na+:H+ antiporter subunit F